MISNKLSEQTSVHLLSTCRLSQDEGPIPRRHTPCENESGICLISNMLRGWRIDKSFCIIVLLACEFSCKLYWWPCLWFCIACTGSLESLGEFQEPPKLTTDNHSNVADNYIYSMWPDKWSIYHTYTMSCITLHSLECIAVRVKLIFSLLKQEHGSSLDQVCPSQNIVTYKNHSLPALLGRSDELQALELWDKVPEQSYSLPLDHI